MERIEDCLSFLLGKAYQQVNQSARQRLATWGVTPVQYAVLKVLWEGKPETAAALGERLRLDSATITGVLDRLEQAGLLERRPDPHDRRVNRIVPTGAARALQPTLDAEMDALNAALRTRLSPEDAARLPSLLATIAGSSETR